MGCVMFEVLALFPLFPGSDEADQIARIHKIMGTPSAAVSALGRRAILCCDAADVVAIAFGCRYPELPAFIAAARLNLFICSCVGDGTEGMAAVEGV